MARRSRFDPWAGGHGSGSREFTSKEYERVVAALLAMRHSTNYELLAEATGLGGRTVRAVLSAADGRDFVLALGDEGVAVADSCDVADRGTRRLRSQARAMEERAERREAWAAANLPRRQRRLFEDE